MIELENLSYEELLALSDWLEKRLKGIVSETSEARTEQFIGQFSSGVNSREKMATLLDQINLLIIRLNEKNSKKKIVDDQYDEIGTYKIIRVAKGYVFCLVGKNGQILAESNIYSTKEGCEKGILNFQKNADAPIDKSLVQKSIRRSNPKFQIYQNEYGFYAFRLRAANGEILIESHSFETIDECADRVRRIGRLAKTQLIENG